MKRKKLFLLLLLICIVAKANDPRTQLVLWTKDGIKVAYALSERPKITFTESELIVETNCVEINYDLKKMLRFTYENVTSTDITDLKSNGIFRFQNNALVFPALPTNSTISVYTLNGILVFQKTVQTAGEYAFSISNLNTGIYLINVNGLTYKILKK